MDTSAKKDKLLFIHNLIADVELELSHPTNNDKLAKLNEKLALLNRDKKRLLDGLDVELTNSVVEYFNYYGDDICHTVDDFVNDIIDMEEDMVYTQLHKTDIIIEQEVHKIWNTINTSCGDKSLGAKFHNIAVDQLVNKNHKQIMNIPIHKRPEDTFENELNILYNHIVNYVKKIYNIDLPKTKYVISYRNDSMDEHRMAYLVIPSHYFNNYVDKTNFINSFREYVQILDNKLISDRIGYCLSHKKISNVEIMSPPMEKTVNDYDSTLLHKNIKWAEISNVKGAAPVTFVMHDNSVNNQIQNVNVNNSSNVTVVGSGAINNISTINYSIHNHEEYIKFISETPPIWHKSGNIVKIDQLYGVYKNDVKGTHNKSTFGRFLSLLPKYYEKTKPYRENGKLITKYKIL